MNAPEPPSAPGEPARPAALGGVLACFSIRSYRWQWSADLLSAWGVEMETIVLAWYVLVQTDSALALAVVGALRFGGTLLAPLFGVLADRMARRDLLVAMRISFALVALVVTGAALSADLPVWLAFVAAALAGLVRPSEMILRQTLIADTVPGHMLMSAIGFARVTMDSSRIFGALLGAGLLSALGIGVAYTGVCALYLLSIVATLRIERTAPALARGTGVSAWADLRSGVAYIRATPLILTIMLLAFLVNFSAFPLLHGLMPVIARELFALDANGLARLVSAVAVGNLIGSLSMAVITRHRQPEWTMLGGLLIWHVLLLLFAAVATPAFAYPVLMLIGLATSIGMVSMSVTLMTHAEPGMRGRVMGVRMLAVYGLPLGLLLGGALMDSIGVRYTIAAQALFGTSLVVLAALCVGRWRGVAGGGGGGSSA